MIDHEDRDQPFIQDGYTILRQLKPFSPERPSNMMVPLEEAKRGEDFDADQLLDEMLKLPELAIE